MLLKRFDELNKTQYENLDINAIYNFPPHILLNRSVANIYKRYDAADKFHVCDKCRDATQCMHPHKLTCSSLFRNIDKIRLVYFSLDTLTH